MSLLICSWHDMTLSKFVFIYSTSLFTVNLCYLQVLAMNKIVLS